MLKPYALIIKSCHFLGLYDLLSFKNSTLTGCYRVPGLKPSGFGFAIEEEYLFT